MFSMLNSDARWAQIHLGIFCTLCCTHTQLAIFIQDFSELHISAVFSSGETALQVLFVLSNVAAGRMQMKLPCTSSSQCENIAKAAKGCMCKAGVKGAG